jgi:hypothetical protein
MPTKRDVQSLAERLTHAVSETSPKLSRSELADKLGITPGAVSHYLNGKRPCPEDVIKRIARITSVDRNWLMHGDEGPGATAAKSKNRGTPLSWGFRKAPADGGKDFGNAAVYATPMAVRTVVRENGQNSLDAAKSSEVTLRFRIIELSPDSERFEKVLKALRFDQLRDRLRAIEQAEEYQSKLGAKLSAGLEHVLEEKLVLLAIDDYGTKGLHGGEVDSRKPFCALVRDNLNSRKDTQTAGGVFGVGAKVNIACSRLSTVLYASKVAQEERRGTRLIGRAEFTYHEIGSGSRKEGFAGPGWLGKRKGEKDAVVESAWLSDDDELLEDLLLRRDRRPQNVKRADSTGTSIMVVGFADPQIESGGSTQQLVDSFVEAAAVSFWPAIIRNTLTVWVERYVDDDDSPVASQRVDPRAIAGVRELCEAYEKASVGPTTPVLNEPGDVAVIPIAITIPATRSSAKGFASHDELTANASLVVRLADPEAASEDPRVSQVAYVRGRGMVTRYQARGSAVGGRPFHAVVLAGTLSGQSPEQVAAEQFLRISEPPAHDKWAYNQDLGERFARGAKKSLDEFHARVTEELQRVLRPHVSRSGDGPEALRKLLQLRTMKQETSKQPQVQILRYTGTIVDGSWVVDAELSINPTPKSVIIVPRLAFRCEGASPIPVQWRSIEVDDPAVEVRENTLYVKPRQKRVHMKGVSDAGSHPAEARHSSAIFEVIARSETVS